MPVKKNILLLIALCLSFNLFAQSYADKFFNLNNYLNQYYISENPAFLHLDNSDELLSISSGYSGTEGSFKKFVDPGKTTNYSLSFEGKKTLDSIQIFKGSFSLSKQEYRDWQWNFTKYYNSGTPFLIGDSTTGKSRFNGINIRSAYNRLLIEGLYAGAKINYFVDEGLKTISPRPVSEHREIGLTLGLGYYLTTNFVAGISIGMYDNFEKINYKEDEGAIYQETKIYKYSGLDLPQILSKKTESRYYYYNGYKGNLGFDFKMNEKIIVVSKFELDNLRSSISDGSTRPYDVGYYNVNNYSGQLAAVYLLEYFSGFVNYEYFNTAGWAKHPYYNILLMENEGEHHKIGLGFNYRITNNLSMASDVSCKLGSIEYNDYYSGLDWNGDSNEFDFKLGLNIAVSSIIKTKLIYGYGAKKIFDETMNNIGDSFFSSNPRRTDALFLLTDYSNHFIGAEFNLLLEKAGKICFNINYNKYNPDESSVQYKNSDLNKVELLLEYRVNVY